MHAAAKRLLDLALALLSLPVTAPVFLTCAAAIRFREGKPVLYRGTRAGLHGRPFVMYKFRTMVSDAEGRGGTSTAADDDRITPVGHVLRRWKLDELPQLVNVLKGEMSLVGPRPQVLDEVATYTDEERQILSVKPGITDYASIRFRDEGEILRGQPDPDEAYQRLIRPEKMRLGLLYAREPSLRADVRILWDTLMAVFGRHHADPRDMDVKSG
jgi:lipopolysaccharide/colanic/teichoic acid biosynthesis glycosyltransferase